jgi:hypothetical protein
MSSLAAPNSPLPFMQRAEIFAPSFALALEVRHSVERALLGDFA